MRKQLTKPDQRAASCSCRVYLGDECAVVVARVVVPAVPALDDGPAGVTDGRRWQTPREAEQRGRIHGGEPRLFLAAVQGQLAPEHLVAGPARVDDQPRHRAVVVRRVQPGLDDRRVVDVVHQALRVLALPVRLVAEGQRERLPLLQAQDARQVVQLRYPAPVLR